MQQHNPLPLVARRAAWNRLWQILLAPVSEPTSGISQNAQGTDARAIAEHTGDRR